MDDGYILQQIALLAQQPGADPSLRTDPTYWLGKIKETGGWTDKTANGSNNIGFWTARSKAGAGGSNTLGGVGSGGMLGGSMLAPFTGSFQGIQSGTGGVPQFGQDFTDKFVPPTGLTLENDPGYQARMKMGTDAIERSAAAKGTLLTGGTLKDLNSWAQDYGSNEYGKVFDRALSDFGTKVTGYNANLSGYNSKLAGNNQAYNQAANTFGINYDIFRNNQNDPFNKLSWLTSLGYNAATGANNAAGAYANNLGANAS